MEQIKSEKKLKICYIPYYGYETNNHAFDNKHKYRWTNVLKDRLEAEGHSIATYDINTIEDSDFIISFDNTYFQNVRHFWNIWKARKLGRTLHIDYEPPSAMAKIHSDKGLKLLSKLFTVMTYNDNVVNGESILKGVVGDFHEVEREYKRDFSKRKLICMITNDRTDKVINHWHSGLYIKRREAAEYFSSHASDSFDLYGSFWPDSYGSKGPVARDKKFDVLSKYKFILSYDSITNQNGYISEKIFDAFNAKVIPIYWGADNVTDYIPKECFIDKRDFATYDELLAYISGMTVKEYDHRIQKIEEYLKSNIYKATFSSDAVADQIIKFLNKKPRHINYIFAGLVFLWFELIRYTRPHYNWNNYYFNKNPLKPNSYINYVDKEISSSTPEFILYTSISESEEVFVQFGDEEGKYKKAVLNRPVINGSYTDGLIRVPYMEIYKRGGSVAFFVHKGKTYLDLKLHNAKAVNLTNFDHLLKFKTRGNKIILAKKLNFIKR